MQLPILTSPEDAFQVVKYLNNKVSGSTIEEMRATIDKKLSDPRKVAAYIAWGFIKKEGNKVQITERGAALAKAAQDEDRREIFKSVISGIPAYKGVIEWIAYKENTASISNVEVAKYWHDTPIYKMEQENDNTLKDRAVCFFKVCEASGVGKLYIGRKGQATRLDAIDRNGLGFVNTANGSEEANDSMQSTGTERKPEECLANPAYESSKQAGIFNQPYPCKNGKIASISIPEDADEQDLQIIYNIFKMVMRGRFGVKDE